MDLLLWFIEISKYARETLDNDRDARVESLASLGFLDRFYFFWEQNLSASNSRPIHWSILFSFAFFPEALPLVKKGCVNGFELIVWLIPLAIRQDIQCLKLTNATRFSITSALYVGWFSDCRWETTMDQVQPKQSKPHRGLIFERNNEE